MKPEATPFLRQLIEKLERNVSKLEEAKNNNDPRGFNEIKKDCFKIHEDIEKLL